MGVSMIVLTAAVNLAISAATVKTVSGPYVAAGVWTGVILASISVIGFYVKIMPKLREINVTARRDEMLQMGMRIEALEKQVKDANEKIIAANNCRSR
jgi:alpha-acetolactate decarboxylase